MIVKIVKMESVNIDCADFVKKVFVSNPGQPKSINMMLKEDGNENGDDLSHLDIFHFLISFLNSGLIHLFGDNNNKVNISNLNDDSINLIKRCIQTIGFNLHFKILNKNIEKSFIIKGTSLDKNCLYLKIDNNNIIFEIKFEYL